MKKRAILLGCAGSIGRSSLDVLDGLADEWDVAGLATGSRGGVLTQLARRYRPQAVALANPQRVEDMRAGLPPGVRLFHGPAAAVELLDAVECDCVIAAIAGAASLPATLRAVELGRRVALANKESLVMAGEMLMALARRTGAEIIPVDSEHSAVFQAVHAGRVEDVRRIVLTASGGPFRTWPREKLRAATVAQALNHPTWDMGPKITIDSATMMNKALEVIEAHRLFDLPVDRIEVAVHPESIVHSMVEFRDGSVIAQLGAPDMRTPIQYALTYPVRRECPAKRLNLLDVGRLTFEPPDFERFPALRLGYEAARSGGTSGAALNAGNEAAVALFREGAIGFTDIAALTERALKEHAWTATPDVDELLRVDRWARDKVIQCTMSLRE
ncbi:MAG: 1-deoxy-D-xylulose-5-phosphate reductoisomerase [Phycisphaerales bacterium]|nr:1-deoxy-D-xylulose-5-phosphate reductoisomerase [Phycisphaerales bacterium]